MPLRLSSAKRVWRCVTTDIQQKTSFSHHIQQVEPTNKPIAKLLKTATEKKAVRDQIEKRRQEERDAREEAKQKLQDAIKERGLVMGKSQHVVSAQFQGEIHWDAEDPNVLRWPVIFAYPEYSQCDFIESLGENDTLEMHLQAMFPKDDYAPWDEKRSYVYDKLCVYYQTNATDIEGQGTNFKKKAFKKIDPQMTLLQALQLPDHVVPAMPLFTVFVKNSQYLKEFMEREKENS